MKLCYSLAQDPEETRINLIQNKIKLPNPSISGAPLVVINELSGISSSETSGAIDFFSFRKQDRGALCLPDPNVSITERCWKLLPGVETLFWSRIALLNTNKLKPPVRPSPADIHRSALWWEGSHKWLKKKKRETEFQDLACLYRERCLCCWCIEKVGNHGRPVSEQGLSATLQLCTTTRLLVWRSSGSFFI